MTEPAEESPPSLIQQRMALQRQKTWAVVLLVIWGINGAWWVTSALLDEEFDAIRVVLGLVFVGLTIAQVFVVRKQVLATRSFEAAHGKDVGMQRS